MKNKYLPINLYEQLIQPDEQVAFWLTSPVPAITLSPTQGLFIAIHGVAPILNISSICGTTYACRFDPKDCKPLNWDVYSIWVGDSSKKLELKPAVVDFHWSKTLPAFMDKDAPQGIKDIIASITGSISD